MPYIVFAILILIAIGIHLALHPSARAWPNIIEVCLLYGLVIGVGLSSLLGFIAHTFFADTTARQIGWPTGNPFQFEVAMANLALAVLGILCIWLRGNFWYATIIGYSILALGAAYGHIVQIIVNQDYAPDNAGAVLYYDILLPVFLLVLLVLSMLPKGAAKAPAVSA